MSRLEWAVDGGKPTTTERFALARESREFALRHLCAGSGARNYIEALASAVITDALSRPTRGAEDVGFRALDAFRAFEAQCIATETTDTGAVWDVLCTLRAAVSVLVGACEHCDGRNGAPVDLGAGGVARLCASCESACLNGTSCAMGTCDEHPVAT
jgi:hypothetical protein